MSFAISEAMRNPTGITISILIKLLNSSIFLYSDLSLRIGVVRVKVNIQHQKIVTKRIRVQCLLQLQ